MKITEHFLQYLWSKQSFSTPVFSCTKNQTIEVLHRGDWNHNQGPDFQFAKIKYQNLEFSGHIELHVKSSDWIRHKHSEQEDYQNIILHVVYENDCEVPFLSKKNIPTLELKNYIEESLLSRYDKINVEPFHFIACEQLIKLDQLPLFFHEELLLKRLHTKVEQLRNELLNSKNNYEAVFFQNLAYAFGLKINATLFKELAEHIDYDIIKKVRQNASNLEALFFGFSGWLEHPTDKTWEKWQRDFLFMSSKYQLSNLRFNPKYSKLRPPNFPNIRWSQLAQLLHQEPHLFSKIKDAKTTESLRQLFSNISATEYWDNHYNFGKLSSEKMIKKLSSEFIDRLLINTILPLKYLLELDDNETINDDIIQFYKTLPAEKNRIISQWNAIGIFTKSALQSQALLHHYNGMCIEKKCLNCAIGYKILKHD